MHFLYCCSSLTEKLLAVVTSACVYDVGYKPKDRTVVMKKISTTLYLQLKKDTDDVLVFQQLVSPIPKPICDYIESKNHWSILRKRNIFRFNFAVFLYFISVFDSHLWRYLDVFMKKYDVLISCKSRKNNADLKQIQFRSFRNNVMFLTLYKVPHLISRMSIASIISMHILPVVFFQVILSKNGPSLEHLDLILTDVTTQKKTAITWP